MYPNSNLLPRNSLFEQPLNSFNSLNYSLINRSKESPREENVNRVLSNNDLERVSSRVDSNLKQGSGQSIFAVLSLALFNNDSHEQAV